MVWLRIGIFERLERANANIGCCATISRDNIFSNFTVYDGQRGRLHLIQRRERVILHKSHKRICQQLGARKLSNMLILNFIGKHNSLLPKSISCCLTSDLPIRIALNVELDFRNCVVCGLQLNSLNFTIAAVIFDCSPATFFIRETCRTCMKLFAVVLYVVDRQHNSVLDCSMPLA